MRTLYDTDILLWSEEQAAALRALSGVEGAYSADWDRIAAAIENVGRSAAADVESGLRSMLVQAISGYCDPDSLLRHERNRRMSDGQHSAARDLSPTVRDRLDLNRIWREAFEEAVIEIPRRILGIPPGIPRDCPFTLDELLSEDFTYDRAVERLYILLTSWRPRARKDAET